MEQRILNCGTNVTSGALQRGVQKWQLPVLSAQIKCLPADCSSPWQVGLICCCCKEAALSAASSQFHDSSSHGALVLPVLAVGRWVGEPAGQGSGQR